MNTRSNPRAIFSVGILLIFSTVLAFKNYTPKTWLIGWDNFMVEFNFALNIKRSLFAVWQEYQGLGLLGGLAHASDLPRQIFLLLSSLIFPDHFLRYFYQFLMLTLGPVGMYLLIKRVFFKNLPEPRREVAASLGGLFYLLNLATLQIFFIPTSMFTTQYGFLPLLLMYSLLYLKEKKKRNLYFFALFSVLALPMAYTPTLFFAYSSVLGILLLAFLISERGHPSTSLEVRNPDITTRVFKIVLLVLVINAYWLLPFLYFSLTKSGDIPNAKINRFASEDGFLRNKEFSTLKDVSILKGFWFEFVEMQPNGKFDYLMPTWRSHLSNHYIEKIGYLLFCIVLLGLIHALYRKLPFTKALLVVFCLSIFILMTENPPLGSIFKFLRDNSRLFREAMRFPFTKFSSIALLTYALFFSSGIYLLQAHLERLSKRLAGIAVYVLIGTLLLVFMWPAFLGNLLSPRVRINIPDEYFELFAFFEGQNNKGKRIANFPQHTFWGWNYYDWGYIGSGFLWYGIEQPLLDRAFDVWSQANEAYYEEMSYAIYSQNLELFESLLDKYQIDYLLLDENVISSTDPAVLYYPQLLDLFSRSEKVALVKELKDIKVYKTKLSHAAKDFVYSAPAKNIGPTYEKAYFDTGFLNEGTYFTQEGSFDLYYPFRSSSQQPQNHPLKINTGERGELTVTASLDSVGGTLEIPGYTEVEDHLPAIFSLEDDFFKITYKTPVILLNGGTITRKKTESLKINTPTIEILGLGYEGKFYGPESQADLSTKKDNVLRLYSRRDGVSKNITATLLSQNIERCGEAKENQQFLKNIEGDLLEISARNARACLLINLASVLEGFKNPGLIKLEFEYKSKEDEKPFFCLHSPDINDCSNPKQNRYPPSTLWHTYEEYLEISGRDPVQLWLQFILEAESTDSLKSINYRNVTLTAYKTAQTVTLTKEHLGSIFGGKIRASPKEINDLSLKLDTLQEDFAFDIKAGAENCDNFNARVFLKEFIETENGQRIVRYSSEDATSCEHLDFSRIPHDQAFILLVETRNISSRPLMLCLENKTSRRCDLQEILSDAVGWKKDYFVIPPMAPPDTGYVLHLYNRAVGNERSINELRDIKLYPLPINYLKNIKISKANSRESPLEEARILEVNKPSVFMYRVSSQAKRNSLLILNQTFDRGWILFEGLLPLGKHVRVNNWANGWLIPPGERHFLILYVPQVLGLIGLCLPPISLVIRLKGNLTAKKN